jgi:hypothetical protein
MPVYSVLAECVCPEVFRQKYFARYLKKNGTGRKPVSTGEEFILSQPASINHLAYCLI